jgi:hypothetical protein
MAGVIFEKGSNLNDTQIGKSLQPIRAYIEQQVEAFENKSLVNEIFIPDTTTDFAAKYGYETSVGNFENTGEGGAYPENGMQDGYSQYLEPCTFKNKLVVTQEMIEDAKFGKIKSKAGMFTLSYGRTREELGAAMLMGASGAAVTYGNGNALLNSYKTTGADAVALFTAAHPSKTGGAANQSNFYAGELTYDNLCYAQQYMHLFKDDDGHLLSISPDTIIIPDDARARKMVADIVGTEGVPGTANNSSNSQKGNWNVLIWPYLNAFIPSGVTAGKMPWFLMDSGFNEVGQGAIWLDRVNLTIKVDMDPANDNTLFKARARFVPGFNNWRAFLGSFPGLGGTAFPA